MQIKSLRVKSYRSFKVNDTLPVEARERLRRLELFQAANGEQNHRQIRKLRDPLHQLDAVDLRQREVEQRQPFRTLAHEPGIA